MAFTEPEDEERPAPKQVVRIVALLAASFSATRGLRPREVISRAKDYEKYIEEG